MTLRWQVTFWTAALCGLRRRALAAERNPAAVRRRHGARLPARPGGQASRARPHQSHAGDASGHRAVRRLVLAPHHPDRADLRRAAQRLHREHSQHHRAAADPGHRSEPAVAAPGRRRGLSRCRHRRPGAAGFRLHGDVPALAVVGRAGADLDLFAPRGDAGGRLLSAVRLGPHDRDDRLLGAAAAPRNRAGARRARSTAPSPGSCAARPPCA